MTKPVLTAVAWPYANGPRHIGHVSGFGVPSDVFSRYQRMVGNDVLMVSGTDEHGTPILVAADEEGYTPAKQLIEDSEAVVPADAVSSSRASMRSTSAASPTRSATRSRCSSTAGCAGAATWSRRSPWGRAR